MDWTQIGTDAIAALTPVVTLVVLWALKLAWDKIPASIVLFAAPIVGMAVNFGVSYLAGHPAASPAIAAVQGLLATVLREWVSTLATKGFSGPITKTPTGL